MEGISKRRLMGILNSHVAYERLELILLAECTELNPWQTIETAPLNKKIRAYSPRSYVKGQHELTLYYESNKRHFTHWQFLPEDPV